MITEMQCRPSQTSLVAGRSSVPPRLGCPLPFPVALSGYDSRRDPDSERIIGHLAPNHRSCSRGGSSSYARGRDQDRVGAYVCVVVYDGGVLLASVPVGRDRSGSDVHVLPDGGVSNVGEMWHLAAVSDSRLLRLYERPDLGRT